MGRHRALVAPRVGRVGRRRKPALRSAVAHLALAVSVAFMVRLATG